MTVNENLTIRKMLIMHGVLKMVSNVCREVDEVREKRFRRSREGDILRRERETNEERQRKFVNLCPHFSLLSIHISVMTLHID